MSEELREAIARGLARAHGASYVEWADAVLALPELAALIADAERVRRVRELADEYGRNATLIRNSLGGADDVILRWVAFVDAATSLRQALDGDQ